MGETRKGTHLYAWKREEISQGMINAYSVIVKPTFKLKGFPSGSPVLLDRQQGIKFFDAVMRDFNHQVYAFICWKNVSVKSIFTNLTIQVSPQSKPLPKAPFTLTATWSDRRSNPKSFIFNNSCRFPLTGVTLTFGKVLCVCPMTRLSLEKFTFMQMSSDPM